MSAFEDAVEAAGNAMVESLLRDPDESVEVLARRGVTTAFKVLLDGLDREALVETCRTGGRPYTDLGRERAGQVAHAVIAHLRDEWSR